MADPFPRDDYHRQFRSPLPDVLDVAGMMHDVTYLHGLRDGSRGCGEVGGWVVDHPLHQSV